MPFRTKDNSLQDCSPGIQFLNIQDAVGENIVRIESTVLKEFNKETILCNKDPIFNIMNCQHNNNDCVVDLCMKW